MTLFAGILTAGSNNHQTTSEVANSFATDFISEGIVGAVTNTSGVAPMTGGFAVNEAGTPDMTVDVSSGYAYVDTTPSSQGSQTIRVWSTATESVAISANSSGSTKYDWVYLTVSAANAANPAVAGDNVLTITTSRSTSASTDDGTPPTYGYPIAVVTVSNGATSIVDANIKDSRASAGPTPADASISIPKINMDYAMGTSIYTFAPGNTTSFDITDMSVTIAPQSTSSKVLIEFGVNYDANNTFGVNVSIVRTIDGGSDATVANYSSFMRPAQAIETQYNGTIYVDSPSTTGVCVYRLQQSVAGALGASVDIKERWIKATEA